MPQAGPYGITQFDAAGVIGNYQAMQENRVRMMILQKQMEREQHKSEVQSGIAAAISRYNSGESDAPAAPGAAPGAAPADATGAAGAVSAYSPPASPSAQPGVHHSGADREKLFGQLMSLDTEVAGNVMDAFSKMDKATADQAANKNLRMMQIAAGVMQLPYEQRRAALQQAAPELQSIGLSPEQITGFDPTDQKLRQMVAQGMDVERISKFVLPDLMNVNGDVIDTQAVGHGDSRPRYRSEFIDTPQGLARRPTSGAPPQTLTDDDIIRMEGGQTGPPSGGFPRE